MGLIVLFLSFPTYAAITLLAATTGADQSTSFNVTNNGSATIIIFAASGHTAAENSDVQISHDGGTTFADLYQNGSQVRLDSTNTAVTVYGPGVFRVDKETTTNATGVFLSTERSL